MPRILTLLSAAGLFFLLSATHASSDNIPHTEGNPAQRKHATFAEKNLLRDPIDPTLTETPLDALADWRLSRELKPALVLFSDTPAFALVPKPLQDNARKLALDASKKGLFEALPYATPNPILLPEMAVRAAVSAGFFSEIIWIAPIRQETRAEITTNVLAGHLLGQKLLTPEEVQTLIETDTGFSGTIEGIPLTIAYPTTLRLKSTKHYVVHFDLDFFVSSYEGEIKTPLYQTIRNQLLELRRNAMKTIGVTLSLSNFGEKLPLKFRGIGKDIAEIIKHPQILDGRMPRVWDLRTRIYYLENFFQPEEILNLARQIVALDPDNPAAYYDLYKASKMNSLDAGRALEKAIGLDVAYALEYLSGARNLRGKDQLPKKISLLKKARTHFPSDPIIKLRLAEALKDSGNASEADELFNTLRKMNWSGIYYQDIPPALD